MSARLDERNTMDPAPEEEHEEHDETRELFLTSIAYPVEVRSTLGAC